MNNICYLLKKELINFSSEKIFQLNALADLQANSRSLLPAVVLSSWAAYYINNSCPQDMNCQYRSFPSYRVEMTVIRYRVTGAIHLS